jgi:hypothetical protein
VASVCFDAEHTTKKSEAIGAPLWYFCCIASEVYIYKCAQNWLRYVLKWFCTDTPPDGSASVPTVGIRRGKIFAWKLGSDTPPIITDAEAAGGVSVYELAR